MGGATSMAEATSTPFGAPTVGDVCPRYVQLGVFSSYVHCIVGVGFLGWSCDDGSFSAFENCKRAGYVFLLPFRLKSTLPQ